MKLKDLNNIFSGDNKALFEKAGVTVVLSLVNRWVKGMTVVIILLIALWLLYAQVWRVFQGEVELPASVGSTKPQLNVEILREINTDRADRAKHKVTDYSQYDRLFQVSSTEQKD